MIRQDVLEVITLVLNDKTVRYSAVFITLSCILLGGFVSNICAVVIFTFYILGYIVAWLLIKYPNKITEYLQKLLKFYYGRISVKNVMKHSCSICDDLSCKRHQQSMSVTPWKYLHINRDLNESIEKFYDRIIEEFIVSWYEQVTEDSDFENELRYCLRYGTATIINRILDLNVADLITSKLIPCAVKHVDDYMYIQQLAKFRNTRFNDIVVEYLGKRLHAAATNRKNELMYLQHLVSSLLTYIVPESYLKCRNYSVVMREILASWVFLPLMDVLADPNIINYLVILGLTYKPKKSSKIPQSVDTVEFLGKYVKIHSKTSPFATNLNKIKNNTDLLYAFMQFLKKQEHVNLLQFCLDVDDFNVKLLTPDLSRNQLEELHTEAIKLYKDYLEKDSLNYVGCPVTLSQNLSSLIKDMYSMDKFTKLSKMLYKAYEHVFNVLESVWLPHFFHSNEFYSYICGSKIIPFYNKPNRTKKYYDSTSQGTVAKISSGLGKIRGVLKANQPIDGSFFPSESQNVEESSVEDILEECKTLFRDLSTWKVSIPSYQASPSNKVIYFCVNIERFDILSESSKRNWVVLRKDQDFYTLKAKLVEFHGENDICDSPLPSRKAGSSIDTRMIKYEEFLKKLLRKPVLRGSDLLHSFLTTQEDFTIFIATSAPNIQDIGNIYQSVAHKLRKEKGQNLDSFMTAFLNSTGKTKSEKLDWEIGEEFDSISTNSGANMPFSRTYRNHIFNDNFGVQYTSLKETMSGSFNPDGFIESIFYLLKHIFKVQDGFLKVYVTICSVAKQLVDLSCRLFIERKLKSCLSQSNLAYLIRLLEDVIFNRGVSSTKEELEQRKIRAFRELEHSIPPLITKVTGSGVQNGFKTLLEILQNPHCNKQLAYNLLDIILTEMYPLLEK